MAIIGVQVDITGTTPLLMHSDRLVDPLDPAAKQFKAISSKRSKTDADYLEMSRLEFLYGLYLDANGAVCIPGRNVTKCFIDGGVITRDGKKIERGFVPSAQDFPLIHGGPTSIEALFADKNYVSRMTIKNGPTSGRVVRCRPIFRSWSVKVQALIDETVIGLNDLAGIARNAGALVGLGDYRSKGGGFGRFQVEVKSMGSR